MSSCLFQLCVWNRSIAGIWAGHRRRRKRAATRTHTRAVAAAGRQLSVAPVLRATCPSLGLLQVGQEMLGILDIKLMEEKFSKQEARETKRSLSSFTR